jgi:shikimate kinase
VTKSDAISLVGPTGAGKTTIGRALARRLGLSFVDSDLELERRTSTTVSQIFATQGEAGFRTRESELIDELTQRTALVLATGGGAVLDPTNRMHLGRRSTVVYLRATPEEVFQRIGQDRNRPLLQTSDPLAKLREMFAIRDPLYRQIADLTYESHQRRTRQLVDLIAAQLELQDWHCEAPTYTPTTDGGMP